MIKNHAFIVKDLEGETVLVPTGEQAAQLNGIITLSEVGTFIWERVTQVASFQEMVGLVCAAYRVSEEKAAADTADFLRQLLEAGILSLSGREW